jgi:hypothetical protein
MFLVGDEELDWPAFAGSPEADFVELAVVAQADLAGLIAPTYRPLSRFLHGVTVLSEMVTGSVPGPGA